MNLHRSVCAALAALVPLVSAAAPCAAQAAAAPRLARTVAVVPDGTYKTGAFCRINYVASRDRYVVTFGTADYSRSGQPGGCDGAGAGFAYKEYTTDLEETGRTGYFLSYPHSCAPGDAGSVMVGDDFFILTGGPGGWLVHRFDPDWRETATVAVALDESTEASNDEMLAYVNGRLDASSLYDRADIPNSPQNGEATHHHFFSTDLEPLGRRVLADTPHVNGSSMIFVDGVYNLVTSTAFFGDLIVLQYDENWTYLGVKSLLPKGQWPQGVAYDGSTFYVSYVNISRPGAPNAHLATFDSDWRQTADVAITDFASGSNMEAGRPSLLLRGDRLFVSYDVSTNDATTHQENQDWKAYVAVFELTSQGPSVALATPNGGETVRRGQTVPIEWSASASGAVTEQDILLSADGGATFPTTIARGLGGDLRSYDWQVPADAAKGRHYRLRVVARDASGGTGADDSDADFRIKRRAN